MNQSRTKKKSYTRKDKCGSEQEAEQSRQSHDHSQHARRRLYFEHTRSFYRDRRRSRSDRDCQPLELDRCRICCYHGSRIVSFHACQTRRFRIRTDLSTSPSCKESSRQRGKRIFASSLDASCGTKKKWEGIASGNLELDYCGFYGFGFYCTSSLGKCRDLFLQGSSGYHDQNVFWTPAHKEALLILPLRSKIRLCLKIILNEKLPAADDRASFMREIEKDFPAYLTKISSAPAVITNQIQQSLRPWTSLILLPWTQQSFSTVSPVMIRNRGDNLSTCTASLRFDGDQCY